MRILRDPILLIIILISLVIGASILHRGHDWGDDFASYIMQTKSILTGTTREFVEHNRFTIEGSSILIGPVAYPWGYPLILAPAYALKGLSPLSLKLPGLFLFLGFLVCLFLLTKDRLTRAESLLLVSLFAFNPLLVDFLNQILSDIPFLFFSTLSLWLMVRDDRQEPRAALFLGIVIACAFFIRTQGILLLVSYGIVEFLRLWKNRTNRDTAKKMLMALLIVFASFGILWLVYALIFPGGGESYFKQYNDFQIERALGFVNGYFLVLGEFFGKSTAWKYLYDLLFVFFLIGLWVRRRQETVFIVFTLIWMLLLITWPSWQGPRFIFPLLPIFIYFVFHGMKFIVQKLPKNGQIWGGRCFALFWLVIIGISLFRSSTEAYANLSRDRKAPDAFEDYSMDMYNFIQDKTPPDSIIVFFKPRAMRLFTDRDSYMALTCSELTRGDYVVLNKIAENSQVPPNEIGGCGIPLKEVFESRRFIVYEIIQ